MPRPRKSVALHVVNGTYRRSRHGNRGAEPNSGPIDRTPPAWLLPGAREHWRRLSVLPWLQRADTQALGIFCQLAADADAGILAAPKLPVLMSLANALGLTPAARSRLEVPAPVKARRRRGLAAFTDPDD